MFILLSFCVKVICKKQVIATQHEQGSVPEKKPSRDKGSVLGFVFHVSV